MNRAVRHPLTPKPFPYEQLADAIAQIALNFDDVVMDRTARSACLFQFPRKLLEERGVPGQIVDDRDGLPSSPRLLDAEFRDDASRDGSINALRAAPALAFRPAASRAHASGAGRVDEPGGFARRHRTIMCEVRTGGKRRQGLPGGTATWRASAAAISRLVMR